jgi:hypothetical protein
MALRFGMRVSRRAISKIQEMSVRKIIGSIDHDDQLHGSHLLNMSRNAAIVDVHLARKTSCKSMRLRFLRDVIFSKVDAGSRVDKSPRSMDCGESWTMAVIAPLTWIEHSLHKNGPGVHGLANLVAILAYLRSFYHVALEGVPPDGKGGPFYFEYQASLAPKPGRRLCFGRNMSPPVCIEDPGGSVLHLRANWATPDAPSLEDTEDAFVEQLTFVAPSLFACHNHSLGNAQLENLLTFVVPSLFARHNYSLGNAQLENLPVYQAWSTRQTSP